eukprot:gene1287-165_t
MSWDPKEWPVKLCSACCTWTSNFSKANYTIGPYRRRCVKCVDSYKQSCDFKLVDEAYNRYTMPDLYDSPQRGVYYFLCVRNLIREGLELSDHSQLNPKMLASHWPWSNRICEAHNVKLMEYYLSHFKHWIFVDDEPEDHVCNPPPDLEELENC